MQRNDLYLPIPILPSGMPAFEFQQGIDKVTQNLDASSASKDPTTVTSVRTIGKAEWQEQLNRAGPYYEPPIDPTYRQWTLRNPVYQSLSPVRLFLLFFQPVVDLIVYHTNITAKRETATNQSWKQVTDTEIRRWLACRLEMIKTTPIRAEMQDFWSRNARSTAALGCQRFKAIERYLCLNSQPEEAVTANQPVQWYWKVQTALAIARTRFKLLPIPSSHIYINESTIKFHGHKLDIFKLPHKPAKEGFICYALTSNGGLIHDFIVASSQNGLEGVPEGITLEIPTKSVRKRERGSTGITATEINLPPIKSLVYILCELKASTRD